MKIFLRMAFWIVVVASYVFSNSSLSFADTNEVNLPEVYIKAINPGYTIDGSSNVGEMIEIGRNSDEMVLLAGLTVGYTNSNGTTTDLVVFPENSYLVGESILLRLASSPDSELADLQYVSTKTFRGVGFTGSLELKRDGEILDEVCWGMKGCEKEFKSAEPRVLVRNDLGGFEMIDVSNYEIAFKEGNYLYEEEVEVVEPQCAGLMFSEILSFYAENKSEQFIEFYNSGSEQVLLNSCKIRYKNKDYSIEGVLKPEEYHVEFLGDFFLTKNPTNVGIVEIIDVDGSVADKLEYPNGQRKGAAYAFLGYDEVGQEVWRTTYAVTPGEANVYQEFKNCEEGKVINAATGNCVKVAVVEEKTCAAGQYLNLITGRCKKIETVVEKTCIDGYELNPETNRCKRIKENTGATYSLRTEAYEEKSSFLALYAVLGVVGVGLMYVVFEFRREIRELFGRVFRRFH